jgi:hypothetical protein
MKRTQPLQRSTLFLQIHKLPDIAGQVNGFFDPSDHFLNIFSGLSAAAVGHESPLKVKTAEIQHLFADTNLLFTRPLLRLFADANLQTYQLPALAEPSNQAFSPTLNTSASLPSPNRSSERRKERNRRN